MVCIVLPVAGRRGERDALSGVGDGGAVQGQFGVQIDEAAIGVGDLRNAVRPRRLDALQHACVWFGEHPLRVDEGDGFCLLA
jgi:hypothetical protein